MADLTDYAEEQFMNWAFSDTAMPSPPATIYVALHTGDPHAGQSGEPATQNEVSAADYDREGLATTGTDWTVSASGSATQAMNDAEIDFGVTETAWGEVTHFSLWTSQSGGNPLWAGALTEAKEVTESDRVRFLEGSITAEID